MKKIVVTIFSLVIGLISSISHAKVGKCHNIEFQPTRGRISIRVFASKYIFPLKSNRIEKKRIMCLENNSSIYIIGSSLGFKEEVKININKPGIIECSENDKKMKCTYKYKALGGKSCHFVHITNEGKRYIQFELQQGVEFYLSPKHPKHKQGIKLCLPTTKLFYIGKRSIGVDILARWRGKPYFTLLINKAGRIKCTSPRFKAVHCKYV